MPLQQAGQDLLQQGPSKVVAKRPVDGKRRRRDALLLSLMPWMLFVSIISLFFLPHEYEALVWAPIVAFIGLSLMLVGAGCMFGGVVLALGLLCSVACAISIPVGNMLWHSYMVDYWRVAGGATYRHVDAADTSASRADATVLKFIEGTRVKGEEGVGLMRGGKVFCVAPVMGSVDSKQPAFWAAGPGCCAARGDFTCGAGTSSTAPTGVVLSKHRADYADAVRMASSVYSLTPSDPMILYWTADADELLSSMWWQAAVVALSAVFVHLLASALGGVFLAKTLPRRPGFPQ